MVITLITIASKIEMCVPMIYFFCGLLFRPFGLVSQGKHPETAGVSLKTPPV